MPRPPSSAQLSADLRGRSSTNAAGGIASPLWGLPLRSGPRSLSRERKIFRDRGVDLLPRAFEVFCHSFFAARSQRGLSHALRRTSLRPSVKGRLAQIMEVVLTSEKVAEKEGSASLSSQHSSSRADLLGNQPPWALGTSVRVSFAVLIRPGECGSLFARVYITPRCLAQLLVIRAPAERYRRGVRLRG